MPEYNVYNSETVADQTLNFYDSMFVYHGGTATNTTVNVGGILVVYSDGKATDIVENGGFVSAWFGGSATYAVNTFSQVVVSSASATVHQATKAVSTTISEDGAMIVYSGGHASDTTISSGGSIKIFSGGKVAGATIFSGGLVAVDSGAKASDVTVRSGGKLVISSGGTAIGMNLEKGVTQNITEGITASSATVSAGASMMISSGGTALSIMENGGYVSAAFDASVTYAANTFSNAVVSSGYATVHSVTKAVSTTISKEGAMYVYGGQASETKVSSGGKLAISSGGTAIGITIYSGGSLILSSGGTANSMSIKNGVDLTLPGRVTADYATVSSGGRLVIDTGADVKWAKILESGTMLVSGGATSATIGSGGSMIVSGEAKRIAVSGTMLVDDWGQATYATIGSGGSMIVSGSQGGAKDTTIEDGGRMTLKKGYVFFTSVTSGGTLVVSGGSASQTFLNSGTMTVSRGGLAISAFANYKGNLFVESGGTALLVVENGGYVEVENGATVTFLSGTIKGLTLSAASATVHSMTTANNVTLDVLGSMTLFSGGVASGTIVNKAGNLKISSGGVASGTTMTSGYVEVWGVVSNTTVSGGAFHVSSGGTATGRLTFAEQGSAYVNSGGIVDFNLTKTYAGADALVNDLSRVIGAPTYALTVSGTQAEGAYKLAGGAGGFDKTISVTNAEGGNLGTLKVGQTVNIGGSGYTLNLDGDNVLSVTVGAAVAAGTAKSDVDGNGISDVLFVWTGTPEEPGNYQHGYWMNGTNEWRSANSNHPAEWDNLGCYDMTGDGKADSVLFGNVTSEAGIHGAYIGYYADANDLPDGSTWVNIGYLTNEDNIDWKNAVGNLTGNASNVNSIVWYAPELYALGVWTDGTENWATLSNQFGGEAWSLVGCGDFSGDGKDQVVMALNGGEVYYTVGIDGASSELAKSDAGWEVRAIGDFSGDGKDDVVAFHKETGLVAMWGDGSMSNWSQLGQLDASDWFVVGCGDYNGDQKDDLLVRQYSTGMLGYYSGGNMENWVELGRGVDMQWTVIA